MQLLQEFRGRRGLISGKSAQGGDKLPGAGMIDNTDGNPHVGTVLQNEGTIVAESSEAAAIGIYYRKWGDGNTKASNNGTIIASGAAAAGVAIGWDKDGDKTFDNNSVIEAVDGAKAIVVEPTGATSEAIINFGEKSNVDGLVDVDERTTLNFNKNTDVIELADDAAAVNAADGSSITIAQGGADGLEIGSVKSDAGSHLEFSLSRMGTEADKVLIVGEIEGDVSVGYTGAVSDELVSGGEVENLFKGVSLGDAQPESVSVAEGAWGDAATYRLNPDGSVSTTGRSTNSLLSSATDLALMNALVWRSQLTNLSDRMGTLRTMPQGMGLWARNNNGRLDGRGIEHDYNTIELGFDAPVSSNFLFGVAFDYTIGDRDVNARTANNDTYTLDVYGSYFGESGAFIDMMAKIGRIDTEYDLSNGITESGDYMMTGAIVGIEAGHRFDINNFYVEPQVQLTYSWLRASDYSTSVRTVEFDNMRSLVARVGVMGGVKFNENRGAAYVKASYNHDFLGDVDASFASFDGRMSRSIEDELDDNWGEVSVGATYNLTDALHAFLDVGTGFGGDIDQKWRVNFGGRYTF